MSWIKTDKHVYGAIYREHHKQLTTFSSFSNPHPSHLSSQPQMITEWGFRDANRPLIKAHSQWEDGKRETTESHDYYIYCAKEKED